MPKADSHEASRAAARIAADQKLGVARGKHAVAVDSQTDRFARTAAEAKRSWNNGNSNDQ